MERTRRSKTERRKRFETISDRQQKVLHCIRKHVVEHKRPPTRGEIARDISESSPVGKGLSPTAVDYHLQQLALRGWIELTPGVQRGIRLLREGTPLLTLAGLERDDENDRRTPRIENIADLFGAIPDMFLRIEDDSMTGTTGLRTGDLVAVRRQEEAEEGDLVITRTERGYELRHFEGETPGTVAPHPAGPETIGVAIGCITKLNRAGRE